MTETSPDHPAGLRYLAAVYGTLGLLEEALVALRQFLRLVPHANIQFVRATTPAATPQDLEPLLDGLRLRLGSIRYWK